MPVRSKTETTFGTIYTAQIPFQMPVRSKTETTTWNGFIRLAQFQMPVRSKTETTRAYGSDEKMIVSDACQIKD